MIADVKYTVDECACLWGECRKRHFHLYDIYGNQEVDVSVCNEYIRLMFQKFLANNKYSLSVGRIDRNDLLRDLMIDILHERFLTHSTKPWLNFDCYYGGVRSTPLTQQTIVYKLIERPQLYFQIPIQQAWDLMYEHKGSGLALDYSYFKNNFHKYLESVFNYLLRHAKYKKQHERAEWLLNKIRPYWGVSQEIMTETALLLLNLKILTHESTSKQ